MNLSDEDRVELGLRAEALLSSHTFKTCIAHLREQYTDAIFTSGPQDTAAREEAYNSHQALQNIVSQLGVYVAEAHLIIERGEQQDNED